MRLSFSKGRVAPIGSPRRCSGIRATVLLGAVSVLCAPPAAANTGIGELAVLFPLGWLLLVIVIPLEAWVAKPLLGIPFRHALDVSIRANLISALLGVPLGWALAGTAGLLDAYFGVIPYPRLPPGEPNYHWTALAMAIVLLAPCFVISVACETAVARYSLEPHRRRRVHLWAWSANALSYLLLLGAVTGYFCAVHPFLRDKVWSIECGSNMKEIGLAIVRYRNDHHDRMPPATDTASLIRALDPYVTRLAITPEYRQRLLRCPATLKPYRLNTALSGVRGASISRPGEIPMLSDAAPHRNGWQGVLFSDGRLGVLHPARH